MLKSDRKTIVVLGGGPAGSATALALIRSGVEADIVLAYRHNQQASIGETIPPAATPALRNLGLENLLDDEIHLPCPGSVSIWGADQPGYNDFLTDPSGKAFHLDRARFDSELRQAAAHQGVEVKSGWRFRKAGPLEEGFRLWFSESGKGSFSLEADFVIDASGQAAAFARRLGVARNLFDAVISVCAFVDSSQAGSTIAPTLVQAQDIGWWYGARLPGNRAIVSLCTDRETLRCKQLAEPGSWFRALQHADWFYGQVQRQLDNAITEPADLYLRTAPSAILSNVVGSNWLAVGDAASSYDSMTSAGITKALLHAHQAGQAAAAWLIEGNETGLRDYQDQVFADFNHYMRLHQRHYRNETRFPGSRFWRNRLRSSV